MVAISVGEVLWDIFSDRELLGGAPLNFCANLQRLGDKAMLLSAVGQDERGRLALERMRLLGLNTDGLQQVRDLPTGIAAISTGPDGEPAFAIPRPVAFDTISIGSDRLSQIEAMNVDWLYFGTLLQTNPEMEQLTHDLARHLSPARCFYDMNLRMGQWNLPLVQRLSRLASIVKLNESEARTLYGLTQTNHAGFSTEDFCKSWASTYDIDLVCVTLGAAGCMIYERGAIYKVSGYFAIVRDTVGAGDAFAAAFLHGYEQGWSTEYAARFANALGAIVAGRAGATPEWTIDEVLAMIASH